MTSNKITVLTLAILASASGRLAAQGFDPVFDDFERASLGPNWGIVNAGTAIVNQSDLGTTNTSGCIGGWTASRFQADQFSATATALDVDPAMLEQVFVRRRTSDSARYGFHWNGAPGMSRWELKYDGVPTAQTRILASLHAPAPQPGDDIRIEVSGTLPVDLRGYHNGQLLLVATDSFSNRITTSGTAGVVARMSHGHVNVPPSAIFEWWSGGSLVRVEGYCTPQHNSLGCIPGIGWSGIPSASAASGLLLNAMNELNNRPGLLFYGTTGATSLPFGLGTLCVNGPIQRTPGQLSGGSPTGSDCSGSYSFDFNAWIASGADPTLVAGQEVWAQYYSRDPGLAPPDSMNATRGIHLTIGP